VNKNTSKNVEILEAVQLGLSEDRFRKNVEAE
jgi:hypothetical protein